MNTISGILYQHDMTNTGKEIGYLCILVHTMYMYIHMYMYVYNTHACVRDLYIYMDAGLINSDHFVTSN